MPPKVESPRRVVFVDGIHLGRKAVVPVASDESRALGWHLCRSENSRAWAALMPRVAAPGVVVSDGGDGFAKALRDHRGLSIERGLKAVFRWCHAHSSDPLPAAEVLRVMPTDRSIAAIYDRLDERQRLEGTIPRWGDAIVWSELHHSEPYRMDWD